MILSFYEQSIDSNLVHIIKAVPENSHIFFLYLLPYFKFFVFYILLRLN